MGARRMKKLIPFVVLVVLLLSLGVQAGDTSQEGFYTCFSGLDDVPTRGPMNHLKQDFFITGVKKDGDAFVLFNKAGALLILPKLHKPEDPKLPRSYLMTVTPPGETKAMQINRFYGPDAKERRAIGITGSPGFNKSTDDLFAKYLDNPIKPLPLGGAMALLRQPTEKKLEEEQLDIQSRIHNVLNGINQGAVWKDFIDLEGVAREKAQIEEAFKRLHACDAFEKDGYVALAHQRRANLYLKLKLFDLMMNPPKSDSAQSKNCPDCR